MPLYAYYNHSNAIQQQKIMFLFLPASSSKYQKYNNENRIENEKKYKMNEMLNSLKWAKNLISTIKFENDGINEAI